MKTVVLALALIAPPCVEAQTSHRLFLSVVDSAARPVPGLTAADFSVIEAGTRREISRLAPANDPMRLVLLVDNSESMKSSIEDVRKGVQAFVDVIPAQHEIGLITIGNTPVIRQTPTTDHAKVKDLAQKMTSTGSTMLITAVMEMYGRFLKDAGGRWPMFIIITSDGPEGSGLVDSGKFTAVVQDMQLKDVVVHAVVMSTMGRGIEVQVTRALTQATDGHYDSISVASALPQKLTTLAGAIVEEFDRTDDEYVLDYTSPSTDPNPNLNVTVNRDARVTMSRGVRIR
jgi:Mg-chelatase subunit ChlD